MPAKYDKNCSLLNSSARPQRAGRDEMRNFRGTAQAAPSPNLPRRRARENYMSLGRCASAATGARPSHKTRSLLTHADAERRRPEPPNSG